MGQPSELTTLLLEGARYGDQEDVQQALDSGADIESRDEQGRTGALRCSRSASCAKKSFCASQLSSKQVCLFVH